MSVRHAVNTENEVLYAKIDRLQDTVIKLRQDNKTMRTRTPLLDVTMIYRTFVMAGRIMSLVVDPDHNQVSVIVGRPATSQEINTIEYQPCYIPTGVLV